MVIYKVVRLDDEGEWRPLQRCQTYEAADQAVDDWMDKYPNAIIDIIKEES
jgi:hypothetical protein